MWVSHLYTVAILLGERWCISLTFLLCARRREKSLFCVVSVLRQEGVALLLGR